VSDETIKIDVNGNAEKKLEGIGKAADSAGKKTAGGFADGVAKGALFFLSIEKASQAMQAYFASGAEGSAELKAAFDDVQKSVVGLLETDFGKQLAGSMTYLSQELSTGLNSIAQGGMTVERVFDNLTVWSLRVAGSARESIGLLSDEVRQQIQDTEDEINQKYAAQVKREKEAAEAAERARRSREQQASADKDLLKLQSDLEASQQGEAIAALKTVDAVNKVKAALKDEMVAAIKAGELTEEKRSRIIGLLKSTEQQIKAIAKAEKDLADQQAKAAAERVKQLEAEAKQRVQLAIDFEKQLREQIEDQKNARELKAQEAAEMFKLEHEIAEQLEKQRVLAIDLFKQSQDITRTVEERAEIETKLRRVQAEFNSLLQAQDRLDERRARASERILEATKKTKEEAAKLGETLDAMFRKMNGQADANNPANPGGLVDAMLNDRQRQAAMNKARLQAKEEARKRAIEINEQRDKDIQAIKDGQRDNPQVMTPQERQREQMRVDKEIAQRRAQANIDRRKVIKDAGKGEGEIARKAQAEQLGDAVGDVADGLRAGRKVSADMFNALKDLAGVVFGHRQEIQGLESQVGELRKLVDILMDQNRRAAMPNFRNAGRLN
jgi:hypothetical protein